MASVSELMTGETRVFLFHDTVFRNNVSSEEATLWLEKTS